VSLQPDDGPCRALCHLAAGVAAHLQGDREAATAELTEGVRRAAVTAPSLHALCLAQLAVLALERGEWEDAAGLVARARAQLDRFGLEDDAQSALVFAVSALVRAHRGRVEEATQDGLRAKRLQAQLVDFAPWFEVETRLMGARADLRLGNATLADRGLREAGRQARALPEAAVLSEWLHEAQMQLGSFAADGATAPSPLTTAELRVLRHLPTHLSFREIAERTFVSANTVKTQANSIYRKLDVSSRSEAVGRARALGLLDRP
jgi:LuxR family maltose regulon positive regulatory protein